MVNVPGVLIVGDWMVQGGNPGIDSETTNLGISDAIPFRDLDLMRVFPDNGTTGAPTASSLGWYPWFDGNAGPALHVIAASPAPSSTRIYVNGTSPGWTVNVHVGKVATITQAFGVGFTARKLITANGANYIDVAAWGLTPTAGLGFFIGDGAWRDYHPVGGTLAFAELGSSISTRGGSAWQALGAGIGLDAGLIRELFNHVWSTAPYFQLAKFASVASVVVGWNAATGTIRSVFTAEVARYNAAWSALANGNTLDWRYIVIDQSQAEVLSWVSTPANYLLFSAALADMIEHIRDELGAPDATVLLIEHDPVINNTAAPLGTGLCNQLLRAVAKADGNARVVSYAGLCRLRGTDFAASLPGSWLPSDNRAGYAASAYWTEHAQAVRKAIVLNEAGVAPAPANGLPIYGYIGDSTVVGPISSAYLAYLASPTITAAQRPAEQMIFNDGNGAGEPYNACDNSNTSGSVTTSAGPEVSMISEFGRMHPEGSLTIKRGSNASALATNVLTYSSGVGGRWAKAYASTEHYNALRDLIADALQWVNTTLGKQGDFRGFVVQLGTNDASIAGGGALFAAALDGFVDDLRADFTTRTSGDPLDIYWRKPQLGNSTGIPAEMATIRAALEAKAASDPRFHLLDGDTYERDSGDNLHDTADAAVQFGLDAAAAIEAVAVADA